jgi:magnesium chelatase subunit H
MEDHYLPVFEALKAKRDHCDAMVCAMSAGDVVKLTKIGKLDMSKPASGPMAILKKLRPKAKTEGEKQTSSGAKQMKVLRLNSTNLALGTWNRARRPSIFFNSCNIG